MKPVVEAECVDEMEADRAGYAAAGWDVARDAVAGFVVVTEVAMMVAERYEHVGHVEVQGSPSSGARFLRWRLLLSLPSGIHGC